MDMYRLLVEGLAEFAGFAGVAEFVAEFPVLVEFPGPLLLYNIHAQECSIQILLHNLLQYLQVELKMA